MNVLALHQKPRMLADVLADLREARDDLDLARLSYVAEEPDADDRVTEAEQRQEVLRDEFSKRLWDATGVTFNQLREAFEEALI